MILVALPLATLASASRLRRASTLSVGMASFSRRMASAVGLLHGQNGLCLALGLQDALLLDGVGPQDGGLLFALGDE